ncbi:hypothetical protein N7499_007422 [Penicillium canescens]|nr:hypothetical protein N7499_007422 [Penicillium canescens]KAJ6175657.1 hypothetical protein N7485_002571 [Penicillium canescens]
MSGITADTVPDGLPKPVHDVVPPSTNGTPSPCLDHQSPGDINEQLSSHTVPFPIAVVGMAMRLPGGVNNADSFWEMLVNKRDGHCEVPGTRYNVDAFYSPSAPGTVKTRHGYFLQDNIAHIDRSFFSMSQMEAAKLDPQQRLLLEVVWECMESGGQTNWRGSNIGCFVGVFGEDWLEISTKDVQSIDRSHALCTGDFAISNRLSYEYDLQGPSITYRTACSSSMVGLHEACQALYSGECSSAIIAGSNLLLAPTMTISISENMVLSPSGLCRTFDAAADGYGRGEAINAVYIKPLADAIQQGDPIRAVIRSTAVNCDGKTPTITTPGSDAQERLIRRAYLKAGIENLSQTAFFECHGTGTIAGDTAETRVVARIFNEGGIYIGAVKPNVGHSEGASGLTSIIKSALALEKRIIPPNAHFLNRNPKIPFEEANLQVPVEPISWPDGKSERVSVNSFGIGGTNVHVIMESFSSSTALPTYGSLSAAVPQLLVLSAKTKKSLQKGTENIHEYVAQHRPAANNLAYTLNIRREHMAHRGFAILDQNGGLSDFEQSHEAPSSISFVFSGQGAQWAGMGRELLSTSACFLKSIQTMDRALKQLVNPPSWTLEGELLKDDEESSISEPEFCQPLCTAIQIALTDILRVWGIHPASVIGHSSGEIAAAYCSGAISAEVAITLSYFRGKAVKELATERGGMAAVGMSAEDVRKYLRKGVTVACENSPASVTLSGDEDTLLSVLEDILSKRQDTFCKQLKVSTAYHSESMQQPGSIYERFITPIMSHGSRMTPLYSTVTGGVITDPSALDAAYWRKNLQSTVLFNGAMNVLIESTQRAKIFVEIGPHSALSSPLRQILRMHDPKQMSTYIPTMIRNEQQWRALLRTAGRLYVGGAPIDLSAVNVTSGKVLIDLPSYPWQHEDCSWSETRLARQWKNCKEPPHELLGSRCLESSDIEPSWRRLLHVGHVPWLWDHVMGKDVIFPCAGYIAMVGEAIRQTTGSEEYTIRNMFMRAPLVLRGDEAAEILTNFRPVKLSDNVESTWYEFAIMAYQNGTWKKHCVGQTRAAMGKPSHAHEIHPYPRSIPSRALYKTAKKRGGVYGPRFRLLQNISASTSTCQASASLQYNEEDGATHCSRYALHPTVIDQSLQLLVVAMNRGILRHLSTFGIPMVIENVDIRPGRGSIFLDASCHGSAQSITGDSIAVMDGEIVLSMKNATLVSVEEIDAANDNGSMIARVEWKPHIDLITLADQLSPGALRASSAQLLDNFTRILIVNTAAKVRSSHPNDSHLKRYQAWLCAQADIISPDKSNGLCLDSLCQEDKLNECIQELEQAMPQLDVICNLARRISDLSADLIQEKISPQDVTDENQSIKALSTFLSISTGCGEFFSLLGHSNPMMRVLTVGIGNGLTTMQVLRGLTCKDGVPMYEKCTVTDISPDLVSQAKERLDWVHNIDYILLDADNNILDQGFETGSYDLIITSEVFDGNRPLSSTFHNLHALLAPGGRLFIQEPCSSTPLVTYIMGIFPMWWVQQPCDNGNHLVSPKEWKTMLEEVKLEEGDEITTSDPSPFRPSTAILWRSRTSVAHQGHISLLYLSTITAWARSVERILVQKGYIVTWLALGQPIPPGTDVVSLIDLEGPFFSNMSGDRFHQLQLFTTQMTHSRILWITESSQMSCNDPRFGLVLGFARTIRHEVMPDFTTFEIDKFDSIGATSVARVLEHVHRQRSCPWVDPDYEFALRQGVVYVSRANWTSTRESLVAAMPPNNGGKALDIGTYGLLSSLAWCEQDQRPLQDNEIEVDMKYVSLNFRDMMVAMGFVGNKSEFGLEGTGLVRRVGSSVEDVRVGEAVLVMGTGLLCTRKIIDAKYCSPLREGLSLADAATMACVYGTVIHSLLHISKIQQGQSVLIHSACGGVGLAAIQTCQMLGAEIFVTVGNEEKVQYLIDTFDIPRDHIFDSRSPSFFQGLMAQTHNRGVDVVLNSLSGELLHLSWKCVAKFGRMIELGKRDLLGHAQLDMSLFAGNRSFTGVDIKQVMEEDPAEFRSLMDEAMAYISEGKLKPIRPVTFFEAVDIFQAFGLMQTGKHMGKIVINMPDDSSVLPISCRLSSVSFSPHDSFLLVGGLGGLGRMVATWMVEKGARDLVFLSRSAGKESDSKSFLKELQSQSCSVTTIRGSVDSLDDVKRAVSACGNRIAGVIQMSMVLRDQLFSKMTHNEWISALAPKVEGTWNLHTTLVGRDLDFFVCFGSLSGLCGNAGQANYAAANSFLDAFVQYRRKQGHVASVIDVGLMENVGFAYEYAPKLLQRAHSASMQTVEEHDLLQALELAILQPGQIATGLGTTRCPSNPDVVPPWTPDARYSLWTKIISSNDTTTTTLEGDVKELVEAIQRSPEILGDPLIENRITKVLGKEIGSHLTSINDMEDDEIQNLVIESLVMIEVRSWFRRHLNLELSLVDISNAGTIGGLGKVTMSALRAKYQTGDANMEADTSSSSDNDTSPGQDLTLGQDIYPITGPIPEWHSGSEGYVLLTGATGFVGAFLLCMLAALPKVQCVICLIRSADESSAMARLETALDKFGLPMNFRDKVRAVPGDISKRDLGLEVAVFAQLAEKCSTVFHLAAAVNFGLPYSDLRSVNVRGLVHVIGFANARRLKSVHYFSSMAAYGPAGFLGNQEFIPENQKPMAGSEQTQNHGGYPLSKCVAENICWDVIGNGLPLTIYRPGFVLGHSVTGVGNAKDAVNRLMSTCIKLGAYPDPPAQRNFFVPVDFVCSAALQISLSNENIGQAYNLIHPDPDQNISLSTTFNIIGQLASPPLRVLEISDWVELFSKSEGHLVTQLAPHIRERLGEDMIWWNRKQDAMVTYGTQNVNRALESQPEILQFTN